MNMCKSKYCKTTATSFIDFSQERKYILNAQNVIKVSQERVCVCCVTQTSSVGVPCQAEKSLQSAPLVH